MSRQLVITYYADRDMLGLVSDEDYEAFKDILLEQLHKEWPKAAVAVDLLLDGEELHGIEIVLVLAAAADVAGRGRGGEEDHAGGEAERVRARGASLRRMAHGRIS